MSMKYLEISYAIRKGENMRKIVPSLWFGNNNCEEAINYYVSVFPNSEIQKVVKYPDENLDEHFTGMSDKILTAEFTLNGQKYIALDGGPYFHFNEAISLTIECEDQDEIDYFWDKLSHVKEAEQCGWAKDKFGLSWQIVPYNMGELVHTDAQIQAMMAMKKIVIKELEEAGLI